MARVRVEQRRGLTTPEKVDIDVAQVTAVDSGGPAERILKVISAFGERPPMATASATMLGCGLLFRDRRMVRAGLRMLAALGVATVAKTLVKDKVDRTRPEQVIKNRRYRLASGESKSRQLRSLPSGHSARAAAVLRAAAREYPGAAIPLTGAALGIAGAQLPTRNHFLTDISAGLAVGVASEKIASALLDRSEAWLEERSA